MEKTEQTKIFADRLSDLVEEEKKNKRIGNNQIAKKIGITNGQLSKYLNNCAEVRISSLSKIASYFKCSTDYLLGNSNVRSEKDNIKVTCATTGLSENAIHYLIKLKNSPNGLFDLDILSYLVTHGDIRKILAHFRVLMTAIFRQTITGTEENLLFSEVNEYDFTKVMVEIYRHICNEGLQYFFEQSKTMFKEEASQNIEKLEVLKAQIDKTIQELNKGKEISITQQDFNAALIRIKLQMEGHQ